MTETLRFLIAESETAQDRQDRRASTGRSSGESYAATLRTLAPGAVCEIACPHETSGAWQSPSELGGYDAVFLTGSPLHVYSDTPEVRRQIEFMQAVFASGTPAFGSCAGLQVAAAAAGGTVRSNTDGHEVAFARRITATEAGRAHPMLRGRPMAWDAPAIHSDEVATLPQGAALLAGNETTPVQAAEVRHGGGTFWGVQYHPELPLEEIAAAMRRQADDIVEQGLASDPDAVEQQASLIEALGHEPERRDLAWRLGLDREVTDTHRRQTELRNFIDHLVQPTRSARGRA